MDEGLELEEVQMLPGALHPVVHRLVRRPADRTGQPGRIARHLEVDRPLIRTKRHAVYRPRRRQPQSLGEELFLHPPRLTSSGGSFHTRRDGAVIDGQYDWQRRNDVASAIVIDRLRIMRLARQFHADDIYVHLTPAVQEARGYAVP